MTFKYILSFLLLLSLLSSCLGTKMSKKAKLAEIQKRIEDSIQEVQKIKRYNDSIEIVRLDSIRIADSIAAIPPPINYDTVLLASIERTPCYGNCPHYEIRYFASGYVQYLGYKNVEKLGKFESRTDSMVFFQLLKMADDAGYFQMNDFYPENGTPISDFPMCITRIRRDSIFKIVYNRNDAPKKLIRLEQYFDELFSDLNWSEMLENYSKD